MASETISRALPPVVGDVSLAEDAYEALYSQDLLSHRHTFSVPDRVIWGFLERIDLVKLHVSRDPISGIDTDQSPMHTYRGETIYVALEDKAGQMYGSRGLSTTSLVKSEPSVLLKDETGQVWLCQTEGGREMRKVEAPTSPLMKVSEEVRRGVSDFNLEDILPVMGDFRISNHGQVMSLDRDAKTPEQMSFEERAKFDHAMTHIGPRVRDAVAKQNTVSTILDAYFSDEPLEVFNTSPDGKLADLIPDWQAPERRIFDRKKFSFNMGLMEQLRDAGVLSASPNNGPRLIPSMTAWDEWIRGADVDWDSADYAIKDRAYELDRSPAFSVLNRSFIQSWVEIKEDHEVRFADFAAKFRERAKSYFIEDVGHSFNLSDLISQADGERYHVVGSFLRPVLGQGELGDIKAVPPIGNPKFVRHLEMPMPSGVLIMTDWIRMKAFAEGIDALCGDDDRYNISCSAGMDERARSYFEKAGICIVFARSSPSAYQEGDGIWRMGRMDEDFVENYVDPAWQTSTEFRANIFADEEIIVDVLLASGTYDSRDEAQDALNDYLKNSVWRTARVDLGIEKLNVYMPTGAAMNDYQLSQSFEVEEFSRSGYMEDAYVISANPLTLKDQTILEQHDWVIAERLYDEGKTAKLGF
jgi:hypothetical protein